MSGRHVSVMAAVGIVGLAALSAVAARAAAAGDKPAEVNACKLLTAKEVSDAIGMPVDEGQRKDSGQTRDGSYSSTCLWRVSADRDTNQADKPLQGARFAILNLMNWPANSGDAKKFLQSFRDAAVDHVIPATPVELKIADEALWWGDGVAVRKGDFSFGISVHLIDGRPKERGIEEALAHKITGRL